MEELPSEKNKNPDPEFDSISNTAEKMELIEFWRKLASLYPGHADKEQFDQVLLDCIKLLRLIDHVTWKHGEDNQNETGTTGKEYFTYEVARLLAVLDDNFIMRDYCEELQKRFADNQQKQNEWWEETAHAAKDAADERETPPPSAAGEPCEDFPF